MNLTKRDGNMFKSYSLDAFDFGQNGRAILQIKKKKSYTGAREPGGSGGVRPPLELEIYIVKISKICKIYFFS